MIGQIKKTLFFVFVFYVLALMQTSFFVHFKIFGFFPNFILIAVILINLFSPFSWQKTSSAFLGGFFLDVFSLNGFAGFFGFYTLTLLGFSLFLKIILEKHFRLSLAGNIKK